MFIFPQFLQRSIEKHILHAIALLKQLGFMILLKQPLSNHQVSPYLNLYVHSYISSLLT